MRRSADRDRLAACRGQNDQLRDELAVARTSAAQWERTAIKVRAQLETARAEHTAQMQAAQQTIRELVQTIARYPDSLADILNPRIEAKPTLGMDSVGFDDALGQPVGMFPAFEDDPAMNGRGEISERDEEWQS